LHEAGGGGYGPPSQRDPESVLDDVVKGYVSVEHARDEYRVAIHEQHGISKIDWDETKKLRAAS
jgi:N-methylhydantoinase B